MTKKIKRSIICGALLGAALLITSGCQGTDKGTTDKETSVQTEAAAASDATEAKAEGSNEGADIQLGTANEAGGWKITLEDIQENKTFENVSTQLGYDDVSTSEFHKEASEGKQFCLLKMVFEKGDSTEEIDFSKLILKDENGNTYNRIDDAFISDLGMKRMPGTKLNFGSNEGWICYEVDENAKQLTLEYPFEGEVFSVKVL